eukprot:CAMPEP_0198489082 /NCGR_PEP_ID=MMETSP1462-20131121/1213_1 /TAXON_ID=1333877 /ORGANISM="Brandtodinium nutriculum, Strain RCC3387" /LENGTH=38 /DNA_ID= /DNA_START= /DNA_END= /DNA_ORIENTATION=
MATITFGVAAIASNTSANGCLEAHACKREARCVELART